MSNTWKKTKKGNYRISRGNSHYTVMKATQGFYIMMIQDGQATTWWKLSTDMATSVSMASSHIKKVIEA